jgi:hypothetical protein
MEKKLFILMIFLSSFIYAQETVLTINVTKVFIGKIIDDKPVFSGGYDNDETFKQIINIEKKEGFLTFKNSMKAQNTFSHGPIDEIIYETPNKDELSTQFIWQFSNSYDDNKGIAYIDIIMVKNKLADKNKIFTAVILIELDNSITQYEGYINSKDFIKIQ